ncbi:LLM class flavin-dependent oxidoreductase [Naumannella halotolerans]|uniref:Luciferase family oxidoreductase group 1 n=1 Tax=Naumannella halotolerans TaxID=993414 RepID=A0A4R7J7Q7_9ACTN|nr:LLM class flavin-dependent oxidoreductase [Naumannella halotolerans]TDT33285.1 luciferase family oxidoreductase group 1 [Naumannella halotolerans]
MTTIPFSVLDLTPISSGSDARQAVLNTIDLAQRAEAAGYHRYWVAEHHLNPGVAGSAPILTIGLIAAATSTIRVGSGAVLAGNHGSLDLVEQFGLLDLLYPGRLDLGLGRSAHRRSGPPPGTEPPAAPPAPQSTASAPNGLLLPAPPAALGKVFGSPRFRAQQELLSGNEIGQPYPEQVADILALLDGTYNVEDQELHAQPGEHAGLEVWILGSSGGESAQLAGRLGLPFGANYHVAPRGVLDAVEGYRAAFTPSSRLSRPWTIVSADVVVADTESEARELAAGYRHWVHSIRSGQGAIAYPSPAEAAELPWSPQEQELVEDRLQTQFVGSPGQVAERLRQLQEATDADELLITSITHDHDDRVRSHELLAKHWETL